MANSALQLRRSRYVIALFLLAAAYFIAGRLGLGFAIIHANVTLIWPPAGLALAALVLFGRRLWPGILIGGLLINMSAGLPLIAAFLIGSGNALAAVIGVRLLERFNFQPAIERARDVLALLGFAAMLSTTISATIGVIALVLSGCAQFGQGLTLWVEWWIGNAIGILTIAPVLLTWGNNWRINWSLWQRLEFLALFLTVIVASQFVFNDQFARIGFYPLSFLILPFQLWIAIRFGQRESATVGVFILGVAIWQTSRQNGLLSRESLNHSALLLSISYVAVVATTNQLVAAIMASHKRVERALAQERDFVTQIMNAMGHGVVVTDSEGRLEYVNPAYAQMLGYRPSELIGRKTSDVSPPDTAFLSPQFLKAQAGRPLAYESRLRRRDGTFMDALVGGTVRLRNGELEGSIVAVTDLTEIKGTEQALLQSQENARVFLDLLKALNEISMEMIQAATFDDLCRMAVELGRSRLKFDRLGLWIIDEQRQTMKGSFGTDERGLIRDEREKVIPLNSASFPGLDQTMTIENLPVYFQEIDNLTNDCGEVVGQGWAAMGYLRDGDQFIGSLSADNLLSQKPIEPYRLAILALYADMLGHVWRQKRAKEALRQSEENARAFLDRLKILHALGMELGRAETFDELCRMAIELGCSGLNFDRLRLWFLDDNGDYMTGSFGIDENGQIRDERGQGYPRDAANFVLKDDLTNIDNLKVNFEPDINLLNDQGEVVGRGWRATAYLSDGARVIAALSADNLLSRKPIESFGLEILALFADVLGNFCTRKRAEIALQESEARFRSVYEGAGMGIVIVNRAGHIVLANPAFERLVGYTLQELGQMTFISLTHPEDRQGNVDLFQDLVTGKREGYEFEKRYILRDNQVIWVRLNVTLFPDPTQQLVIATVQDISRRREAEEALLQLNNQLELRITERTAELQATNERLTELDRMKTKFIADVTHELRTPLAVLNTRIYLLQRSPPEKWPGYISDLTYQVERLTNFTNTILDLSRMELGKDKIAFSPVDLTDVSRQVIAALKPRAEVAGLELTCSCQPHLPAVCGELNQLAQVITNLVANAINYTAQGSIQIQVRLHSNQQFACFEIQDTGIGIPQDDIPHLFNRFYRAANTAQSNIPGSGLGLSIVKEIVDLHNGEIQIESQVGVGTTIRVLIPIYRVDFGLSLEDPALEMRP